MLSDRLLHKGHGVPSHVRKRTDNLVIGIGSLLGGLVGHLEGREQPKDDEGGALKVSSMRLCRSAKGGIYDE